MYINANKQPVLNQGYYEFPMGHFPHFFSKKAFVPCFYCYQLKYKE